MAAIRILLPTDFSSCSDLALTFAIALANEDPESLLILLHVVDSSVPEYDDELGVLGPESLKTKMLTVEASRRCRSNIDSIVMFGDPTASIIAALSQHEIDFVVMGSHGRGGVVDYIFGSVAQAVTRQAVCPVLTVREGLTDD